MPSYGYNDSDFLLGVDGEVDVLQDVLLGAAISQVDVLVREFAVGRPVFDHSTDPVLLLDTCVLQDSFH
jgi:myo-inositol catabolism protein IolC